MCVKCPLLSSDFKNNFASRDVFQSKSSALDLTKVAKGGQTQKNSNCYMHNFENIHCEMRQKITIELKWKYRGAGCMRVVKTANVTCTILRIFNAKCAKKLPSH
jgi:hypothetical protein